VHRLVGGVTGPPSGGGHAALADVATLGTPFVISTDPGEATDPTWRSLADLVADPALLRERVERARDLFGTTEDRVAAS